MDRRQRVNCVFPRSVFLAIVSAMFALPVPAHSDNGPACVAAMVRSVDQVSAVHGISFRDCARQSSLGRLPTDLDFPGCLVRKDEGAFRRHALEATARRSTQSCVPVPSFGYVGSDSVNRFASEWETQVATDVFGAAIADALVPAAADAVVSACQLAAMRGYAKLRAIALDGLSRCLQATVASGADWTPAAVGNCIQGGDADELAKLQRAEEVFRNVLAAACTGASVSQAFPGKCSGAATMADAVACMVAPVRCRTCRMSESALGVVADCETYDDGKADGSCPANSSACGNGIAEPGEVCDSADFGGITCATFGFVQGNLQCTSLCQISTAGCTHCGNGVDPDEQCDAADLAGATCQSLGFQAGTVTCNDHCQFDTAGCTTCGDGLVGGVEQCDGTNLAGQSCTTAGFDSGSLSCDGGCQFDTSTCYHCGDGQIDPTEQCDGENLAGQTCQGLGFVGGQLSCSQTCGYETSLCFSGCNQGAVPPADLKFTVGDQLWLFGDSITAAFHENRYHYGLILMKVLGSSYCSFTDGFSVRAIGHKGSTYARYPSYVRHYFPDPSSGQRRWVMFEDFGKTVKLNRLRFETAVRSTVAVTREIDPDAQVMLGTTPSIEETPSRPGMCRYYQSVCNFAAHNDIVSSHLSPELAVNAVPWNADFCRLLVHRPSLLDLEYTTDGIHPTPVGNLGLALSILKWSGVPRQDLVLSGLEPLDPVLTLAEAEQIADWIYDPVDYDCTTILEPCGAQGDECLSYLSRNVH